MISLKVAEKKRPMNNWLLNMVISWFLIFRQNSSKRRKPLELVIY